MATVSYGQTGDPDAIPVLRLGRVVDNVFGEAKVEQFFESGGWETWEQLIEKSGVPFSFLIIGDCHAMPLLGRFEGHQITQDIRNSVWYASKAIWVVILLSW